MAWFTLTHVVTRWCLLRKRSARE